MAKIQCSIMRNSSHRLSKFGQIELGTVHGPLLSELGKSDKMSGLFIFSSEPNISARGPYKVKNFKMVKL